MARSYQLNNTITRWREDDSERDAYGRSPLKAETFKCRYQEQNKLYPGEFGDSQRSNAYIYMNGPYLELGDIVAKGDHTAYRDHNGDIKPVVGAFEVKSKRITENQRGTRTEYRYIL